jgi:hypothetical protein
MLIFCHKGGKKPAFGKINSTLFCQTQAFLTLLAEYYAIFAS